MPFILLFIAWLAASLDATAVAAPKLQQFAVRANDGLALALWARA